MKLREILPMESALDMSLDGGSPSISKDQKNRIFPSKELMATEPLCNGRTSLDSENRNSGLGGQK